MQWFITRIYHNILQVQNTQTLLQQNYIYVYLFNTVTYLWSPIQLIQRTWVINEELTYVNTQEFTYLGALLMHSHIWQYHKDTHMTENPYLSINANQDTHVSENLLSKHLPA